MCRRETVHGTAIYFGPVLRRIRRVQPVVLVHRSGVVVRKCGSPCPCMAERAPVQRRPDVSPGNVMDLERGRVSRAAVHTYQPRCLVVRGPVHDRRPLVVLVGRSQPDRGAVPDGSELRSRDSTGVLCAGVSVPEFWDWPPLPGDPHVRRAVPDGHSDDWRSARGTWWPAALPGGDSSCLGIHWRIRGTPLWRVDGLHAVGGRRLTGGIPDPGGSSTFGLSASRSTTMVSRRTFLRYTSGTALTLFAFSKLGGLRQALAQIPGGTLDPLSVPKYATPLLIPPVMPRAGMMTLTGGKNADYYEISMKQFVQQILPSGLPATTVWGYGAVAAGSQRGLLVHHAPSLTIEARWNRPVRVKWINGLQDANGDFLPHLLPVDPTLHWANPPGGTAGRDTRPAFASTPGPYTGPVPI